MKKLFAPPDPEYDRKLLDQYSQWQKGKFFEKVLTWEETEQSLKEAERWRIENKLISKSPALRLEIRTIYEKFKRWFYPDGWNRLLGILIHPSDLITYTKAIWGKKLRRDISDEEATAIIRPFRNFLLLLKEIKCPTRP